MSRSSEEITKEIKELEAVDCSKMDKTESLIHLQKIKDAYWSRRRAWERERGLPPSAI